VTFLANAGGSIFPIGNINYAGVTVIDITAIPEDGHLFSTWNITGDVEIANSTSASTTVTAYGLGTVTALFRQADSDLPIAVGLSPANSSTVNEGPVKIRISFSEGVEIDPSTVALKLDGVEVSGADVTASGVAYEGTLGPGAHTVELTVKYVLGNTMTATWDLVASQPFSISRELYATIAAEIVVAGLIVFLWWRGRSRLARVPRPAKKPVVH
jgi:hypothetical protein